MKIKNSSREWLTLAFVTLGLASLIVTFWPSMQPQEAALHKAAPPTPDEPVFPHTIPRQSTFYNVLRAQGVSPQAIHQIVQASKPVSDLARLQAGTPYRLEFAQGEPTRLEAIMFRLSAVERLEIDRHGETWSARLVKHQVTTRTVTFGGVVSSTLWESAERASMDPNLIVDLAEIFGWQVDFQREVRVNDRWRLTVEQKMANGKPVGWGAIQAAEYENSGQVYRAVLFQKNGQSIGYFAPDGSSLRRMFLKSPIRYGRISSRFNRKRFHPVLKIRRPHLGVDYAAAPGTPIRAVGDGVVTHAAWLGGGGRTIKIRHNSIYKTAYLHLQGFAKGIRAGARVQQGQVIGYVGSTGLSTGPHLHFEFHKNGVVVDPLGQQFPTADPVPNESLSEFQSQAQILLAQLPDWQKLPEL